MQPDKNFGAFARIQVFSCTQYYFSPIISNHRVEPTQGVKAQMLGAKIPCSASLRQESRGKEHGDSACSIIEGAEACRGHIGYKWK